MLKRSDDHHLSGLLLLFVPDTARPCCPCCALQRLGGSEVFTTPFSESIIQPSELLSESRRPSVSVRLLIYSPNIPQYLDLAVLPSGLLINTISAPGSLHIVPT